MSNRLIDFQYSAVAPISKDSSNDHEQNRKSLLGFFNCDDKIAVYPVSVQNKCSKMEMTNWLESLDITDMKEQVPSIRDYSTKGELTQLIEEDLTKSGNSTLNTHSLTREPQRDRESSSKGIFKSDASVPQEVVYDSVDSNKMVEPIVQSTLSDSDSEIES